MIALMVAGMLASTPGVYEPHDKFPERVVIWKDTAATSEDECHEHHHLAPDGDHDCDDVKGVPEPDGWAPTTLLALGVGAVYLSGRRRRA